VPCSLPLRWEWCELACGKRSSGKKSRACFLYPVSVEFAPRQSHMIIERSWRSILDLMRACVMHMMRSILSTYLDIGSYVTWWRHRYISRVICLYSLSVRTLILPSIVFQQECENPLCTPSPFSQRKSLLWLNSPCLQNLSPWCCRCCRCKSLLPGRGSV